MKITKRNFLLLTVNIGSAIGNIYQAPGKFSLGFGVGIILGMGAGLKQRLSLIAVDLNEKAIKKVGAATQTLQGVLPPVVEKINDSNLSKHGEKILNYTQPFFRAFLYFSGYGKILDTASSYVSNFEEQRFQLLKKLNPIPGKLLSFLSISSLIVNLGYVQKPIISKVMGVLSGLPMGYATGKLLMRNFDWCFLRSDSYTQALDKFAV
jgi:hypothetical protein